MSDYQITNLEQQYGARKLYEIAQLTIPANARIGLIGHNGVGKTTLLNQLATKGTIQPEADVLLVPQLKPTAALSGGEQVRQYLNDAFSKRPDILLLDEPTANLDVATIKWLEKRLKRFRGALVIISHDRDFLDDLCTTVWALSEAVVTVYSGNYSAYLSQREAEKGRQQAQYDQYVTEKKRLKKTIEKQKQRAEHATVVPKNKRGTSEIHGSKPYFEKMSKKLHQVAKATGSRMAQLEEVRRPKTAKPVQMMIPNAVKMAGNTLLTVTDLTVTQGGHQLVRNVSFKIKAGDHVAITGPNKAGKTSLLTTLLHQDDDTVKWSPLAKLGYFQQNLSNLNLEGSILANVTSTSIQDDETNRLILARLGFSASDWDKPVTVLSGGKRVKVSLAKVILSDVNGLILDEPTNFLDIEAVTALSEMLREYKGTVILVSHDRWFVRQVTARQYHIRNQQLVTEQSDQQARATTYDAEKLQLELKQTELINQLAVAPNDTALEDEFQAVSRRLRELS
ncbi:ribosomal protection-like ABC-F family protein [Secundilactobacillus paracollinoides]|uniref:ribosomal protection-like ABC-F family protein n=1 Tax=Secundilactobacillus paracollinoides TaxID=240427 RepID=UPI003F4730D5